jgi:hypothetical protein
LVITFFECEERKATLRVAFVVKSKKPPSLEKLEDRLARPTLYFLLLFNSFHPGGLSLCGAWETELSATTVCAEGRHVVYVQSFALGGWGAEGGADDLDAQG